MSTPNIRVLPASASMPSAPGTLATWPALAALCITGITNAQAAVQTYSNEASPEASFLAAVGPVRTENFNAFSSDVAPAGVTLFSFTDFTVLGRWVIDAPATQLPTDGSTNLFMDGQFRRLYAAAVLATALGLGRLVQPCA